MRRLFAGVLLSGAGDLTAHAHELNDCGRSSNRGQPFGHELWCSRTTERGHETCLDAS